MTRVLAAAGVALALVLTACTTTDEPPRTPAATAVWDTSWEAATAEPDGGRAEAGFTDTTVRQVAHLSIGGTALRLTLSNTYGSESLRVDRTTVADSTGGADAAEGSVQEVRFGGRTQVTVPPGAQMTSDPVTRDVADRSDLVVSTYLAGPTGTLDLHGYGMQTMYTADGDATSSTGDGYSAAGAQRYVLTDVQVLAADPRPTVAFFGDSITDGFGGVVDRDTRYPDQLAELYDDDAVPGIANAGISGNLLTGDNGAAGVRGVERFLRDVVARPGVETCVVLIGINDINSNVTASRLADGYRALVSQAHAAGIRVIGATILPQRGFAAWTPARERERQAANSFIRNSGTFDAVVDLDATVRDPDHTDRMRTAYDSGDHLHPGPAGYRAMAVAVYRVLRGPAE